MSSATDTPSRNGGPAMAAPQNVEAEQSVLGAILLADRTMHHLVIESGLRPEDFYREQHALIYRAMTRLFDAGKPIDQLTVADQLSRDGTLEAAGGRPSLDALYGAVPNAANVVSYAKIVRDSAACRRVLSATYELQSMVATRQHDGEALIEEAERRILALRGDQLPGSLVLLGEAVETRLEHLLERQHDDRDVPGLRSGIADLDRMLAGFLPGRMYVVAARPEMGKSLLVQQIAMHAALNEGTRTLMALLEMDDQEAAERYLAMESGVSPTRLRLGKVKDDDWSHLLRAQTSAHGAPLHFLDDSHVSLSSLRAHARQLAARHRDLGLIVVDYLQLMHVEKPSGNRTTDVSNLSRGLKVLARELRVPVIAVSQLNRGVEGRPDKRPQLADLRETGAIEADANSVLMLYRDDYYEGEESTRPGELDIFVRKNRNGEKGKITLRQDRRLRHLPLAHVA
jgi:replicative DNA helicase